MGRGNLQLFVKAQKTDFSRCLHSSMDCQEKAIRAHSIQNSHVLDLIHTDGHLMMPRYRLTNGEPKIEMARVGRQDASTFNGLCSKHDIELFKAIDTGPLRVDDCEQRRQLAYRALTREFHAELQNADRAHVHHEEICKSKGVDWKTTETTALRQWLGWMKKSHELFRFRMKHFDRPMEEGRNPDLRHLIITMDNQAPILAVSGFFSVGFTPGGDVIGAMLTVVPLGPKYTVAILSYPTEQKAAVEKALAKVFDADEQTLKYELAKLIIQRVENFTLSPAHYAKWSDDKKARVIREFEKSLTEPKEPENHPDLNIFL